MELGRKERFSTIYVNLPLGVRKEVVLVLDDQPISWEVAFAEVSSGTELSERILEKLEHLAII